MRPRVSSLRRVETLRGTTHNVKEEMRYGVRTVCGLKLRTRSGGGQQMSRGWFRNESMATTCKRCNLSAYIRRDRNMALGRHPYRIGRMQ